MSSDAAFYGDGSKIIATAVEATQNPRLASASNFDIVEYYEIARCVEWLNSCTDISKVALQFPDELLTDSVAVVEKLKQLMPSLTFFVLADTSYGSCCVDLIAAQHYKADALIHFGNSCLSPVSGFPVLWVFGRLPLDVSDCCQQLTALLGDQTDSDRQRVLMFDVLYDYIIDELFTELKNHFPTLAISHLRSCANLEENDDSSDTSRVKVNGRSWCCVQGANARDYDVIYIGGEGRTLTNLMFTMNGSKFHSYNPATKTCRLEAVNINKALMKRMYLIERAKDANIIGIVVGTLAVADYLSIHTRLKALIEKAGRKSYSIVVGKLNTAKLANFMEVDMFVLVGCAENTLVDSTEYYKPIITPYELELAFNTSRQWDGDYVTDFRSLLPEGSKYQTLPDAMDVEVDVSLVTGSMRTVGVTEGSDSSKQVAVKNTSTALSVTSAKSAGEYLAGRTWSGLQQDLGQTLVEKAKQGRKGIAMGYEGEPT